MLIETLILAVVKSLILPPGLFVILALVGFLCWRRMHAIALFALYSSAVGLYFCSTPFVSHWLEQSLTRYPALNSTAVQVLPENAAIVILGGGRHRRLQEYNNLDTVNALTLERLRYGARLHKQTKLPIVLSGGRVFGEATPEAVLMNQVMVSDFSVTPYLLETTSHNTATNASRTSELLKSYDIDQAVLVSHGWHLARAVPIFEKAGICVIPAPIGVKRAVSEGPITLLSWLPSANALLKSRHALHEWLGVIWYDLRYNRSDDSAPKKEVSHENAAS